MIKLSIKYTYPIGIRQCEILIIDARIVSKKTIPDQHWFRPLTNMEFTTKRTIEMGADRSWL